MTSTRHDVYEAIDGERDYQDSKDPKRHDLGAEIALMVKRAHEVLGDWHTFPFEETELKARATIRDLAAICVRALENHGAPIRALAHAPGIPTRDRNAWKAGKTVHTIAFVDEAEQVILTPAVAITEIADLRDTINGLMRGVASLEEPMTVVEWIAMHRARQL
jgi:hypothetical protein